jgi:LmbE family N-acetylglucosaminyl deacetylase
MITSFNQLHGHQDIRSTYHTTLQATPSQLVFGQDMIHNIAFRENWDGIQKRKQDIIN